MKRALYSLLSILVLLLPSCAFFEGEVQGVEEASDTLIEKQAGLGTIEEQLATEREMTLPNEEHITTLETKKEEAEKAVNEAREEWDAANERLENKAASLANDLGGSNAIMRPIIGAASLAFVTWLRMRATSRKVVTASV